MVSKPYHACVPSLNINTLHWQGSGSVKFWYGSGCADPYLCLKDPDSDPLTTNIFSLEFFAYYRYFLNVLYIILKKWKSGFFYYVVIKSRNQCFFDYFCLMMEGSGSESGSGSIPLTNGSGSGRPKKKTYVSGTPHYRNVSVRADLQTASQRLSLVSGQVTWLIYNLLMLYNYERAWRREIKLPDLPFMFHEVKKIKFSLCIFCNWSFLTWRRFFLPNFSALQNLVKRYCRVLYKKKLEPFCIQHRCGTLVPYISSNDWYRQKKH